MFTAHFDSNSGPSYPKN